MKKGRIINTFFLFLGLGLIACSNNGAETSNVEESGVDAESEESELVNELNVALDAQPLSLDPHIDPAEYSWVVTRHIYETLFTINSEYEPIPMLAESVDISEDGETYTFHLREGVEFHNGKEMTAEDVVASMNRWMETYAIAEEALNNGAFEEIDKYAVELKMDNPSFITLDVLATYKQSPVIMPKEVIESADSDGVDEHIGTGPFKFEGWEQDQYIHLSKYNDYKPLSTSSDGLSGEKEALVDDIYFQIATDPQTRTAGIQTEEYDVALNMAPDNYEQLMSMNNVETHIYPQGNSVLVYNEENGLFVDLEMRQAVNTALDLEPILQAAFGHKDFYELHSGYMNSMQQEWRSDEGNEFYNVADQEKAKQLLDDAGYSGEEVKILTTTSDSYQHNGAIVAEQQLEDIGINVELEALEWGVFLEERSDVENWDIATGGFAVVATPNEYLPLSPGWDGGTVDPNISELLSKIKSSDTRDEAKELWDELQGYAWSELVPITLLGEFNAYLATTERVEGLSTQHGPILWNTKVFQ